MYSESAFDLVLSIVTAVPEGRPEGTPMGGTVSRLGRELPLTGYFVGGMVPGLVYESFVSLDAPEVARYVDGLPTDFAGWWVDRDDGKIYVDAIEWCASEFTACQVGRKYNEIAVWDIRRGEEIRLDYGKGEAL